MFVFRLALALHWPSVAWGLRNISSYELSEWMAYDSLAPFGDERADLRAGTIAATIANANRDPEKQPEPFTPADFMPVYDVESHEPEGQSVERQIAIVEMLNVAFGGRDLRNMMK